ncbi:MAG: hypothetical protein AB1349_04100 [Elusimicrobiota bacterium]
MDNTNKILKELVKFVREQRKMNVQFHADMEKANIEQHKMNMYIEKRLQLHYTLLREQREWLKNHEVRLKTIEVK